MTSRYDRYAQIQLDRPHPRVLRITMNKPERLNADRPGDARELARIWRDVDADPDTSAVIVTGAGRAFSAGGDLDMVERTGRRLRRALPGLEGSAQPRLQHRQLPQADRQRDARARRSAPGSSSALLADISIAAKTARLIDGHTRLGVAAGDHAAIVWPLLCGMAKAKYYLLLCEHAHRRGGRADRPGLARGRRRSSSTTRRSRVAVRLAEGAPAAIRWTKYALNNWLRRAGPAFDASLALEFLGFAGPDVREGIASLREKRAPKFNPSSPL